MVKPVGGRGNKAPYESTHVRVPLPIKADVQALIDEFREKQIEQPKKPLTSLEDEEEDSYEPSDLETIKSQAEAIQNHLSEIRYLNFKLEQSNLLTSLEDAKKLANTCLKSKKGGKWAEVARLLSGIYQAEVTEEDLK